MALNNPQNLYTGDAVVVNTLPYLQYMDAKKKAKDAAANQYFTKLTEKINTAGVRQQDLMGEHGGIMNDIEDWKRDAMTNKGALGMQREMLNNKFQKILNKIEQSKNAAKKELQLGEAKLKGDYDPTDDDLHVLDKLSKSIYDPQYYKEDGVSEYGIGDVSHAVGQFDPTKQNTFFNAAIGKNKPDYDEKNARIDNVTGKVYVPQRYSGETIKNIADNAGNIFEGSPEAKKHYGKLLYDKSFLIPANEEFKSVYGRDIQTAKELAMADAIIRAKNVDSEVAVTDVNYAQRLKKEMERIRDANIIKRKNVSSGSGAADVGFISEEVAKTYAEQPPKIENKAKSIFSFPTKEIEIPEGALVIYEDNVDQDRLDIIKGRDLNKKQTGTKPLDIPQEDGTIRKGFLYYPKTGEWEGAGKKKISKYAAKDRYVNKFPSTKFKASVGTKGQEGDNVNDDPLGIH